MLINVCRALGCYVCCDMRRVVRATSEVCSCSGVLRTAWPMNRTPARTAGAAAAPSKYWNLRNDSGIESAGFSLARCVRISYVTRTRLSRGTWTGTVVEVCPISHSDSMQPRRSVRPRLSTHTRLVVQYRPRASRSAAESFEGNCTITWWFGTVGVSLSLNESLRGPPGIMNGW